jgi:hypothetical protein
LYEEHEQPYDFYRYTQFALRHLLREAGFSVCQLEWMEGYYGTLSYQLHFASMNLSGTGRSLGRILVALALEIAARWCTQADLRQRVTTYGMPINYCVVASRLDRAAD